jgi:MFS family permease
MSGAERAGSSQASEAAARRKAAFRFIGLMGLVSFFGDVTYEAVRSVSGPYLATLGGGAAVVGFVAGFGQFAGYALRLLSGWYADRTERYWALTIVGYGTLLLLPLLAFVGSWQVAAALLIGERVGKAVRTPARDAIISHAAKDVGRGIGFGFHEFMDKVGSMVGPLLFSGLLLLRGGYRFGLSLLWIPAACCIGVLLWSRSRLARPDRLEADGPRLAPSDTAKLSRLFWAYAGFTFLAVAGFASFPLMAYHFKVRSLMGDAAIPLVFAIGMGIDAVAALAIGRIYDKVGLELASLPVLVQVLRRRHQTEWGRAGG